MPIKSQFVGQLNSPGMRGEETRQDSSLLPSRAVTLWGKETVASLKSSESNGENMQADSYHPTVREVQSSEKCRIVGTQRRAPYPVGSGSPKAMRFLSLSC